MSADSDRYPRFVEARHPLVGSDGSAYGSLLRFKFNPTLSGDGSNTQAIVATTSGTYTIGLLETGAMYKLHAVECVATMASDVTVSLLTRDPPATLAFNFTGGSLSAGEVKSTGLLSSVTNEGQVVRLASASQVGSLSVRITGNSAVGELNFYVEKLPVDSDIKDVGLASITTTS